MVLPSLPPATAMPPAPPFPKVATVVLPATPPVPPAAPPPIVSTSVLSGMSAGTSGRRPPVPPSLLLPELEQPSSKRTSAILPEGRMAAVHFLIRHPGAQDHHHFRNAEHAHWNPKRSQFASRISTPRGRGHLRSPHPPVASAARGARRMAFDGTRALPTWAVRSKRLASLPSGLLRDGRAPLPAPDDGATVPATADESPHDSNGGNFPSLNRPHSAATAHLRSGRPTGG
jgi:hypothetical protein